MSSNTAPLDPRVQRTRQLLQDSLLSLLNEKKFQAITVQQIAARAGVNRVTFYAHYEDKYDLYRHIVRKTFQRMVGENMAATAASGLENLRALVHSVCVFFEQLNTTCPPTDRQSRPLVEVEVQAQLYDHLLWWLQRQQAMGLQLPTKLETTAKMMSWAIFGTGLEWEQNSATGSVAELTAEIFAVVARMASGEKANSQTELAHVP